MAASVFLAGTGRRCTNPPPNIAHGGWGAQKHEQAEGIDLDLWTTALAVSDGKSTAIILDVDIQILTNNRADQIRRAVSQSTGVPIAHIRACATHTHSGPVPYKSWIEKGYEMVDPWFNDLARWSAEAAAEAIGNLQPAEVRVARGECQINANRRVVTKSGERFLGVNPDGVCDHEVVVVRIDLPGHGREGHDKGRLGNRPPIATIAHFACHATIMGPGNRLITPDYPGAMKRVVEQAVGGRCIFLQGAAGDMGPVQGFQADPAVYRQLGAVLGHEVAARAAGLIGIPSAVTLREVVPSGAPLGMYDAQFTAGPALPVQVRELAVPLPLRDSLPDKAAATADLAKWRHALDAARARHDDAAIAEAIYMARRADIRLRMADDFGGQTRAPVRVHFVTFGDVAFIGCNVEPFCEIGLAIKRQSPFPTACLSGYSNGRMAYLPTAAEWDQGGYEVENSPFGRDAAQTLQDEILRELHALRQAKASG